jgi:hypothetical protein
VVEVQKSVCLSKEMTHDKQVNMPKPLRSVALRFVSSEWSDLPPTGAMSDRADSRGHHPEIMLEYDDYVYI